VIRHSARSAGPGGDRAAGFDQELVGRSTSPDLLDLARPLDLADLDRLLIRWTDDAWHS
jgi:hypothetical protein